MTHTPSAPSPPRGSPAVSAGIRRKLTSEREDASAYLSRRYCAHQLDLPQGEAGLDFSHVSMDLGSASAFNMLHYGAEVTIASGFDEFYMLEMPLTGGVDIDFGNERYRSRAGQALLLSPGPRFLSRWQRGTRQAMLQIHRDQLRARLAQLSRRNPVDLPVFSPVIDLRSECGRKVRDVLSGLARLSDDSMAAPPASAVVEGLIDALLQNMAYRSGESLRLNRLHATPRQIRRAHEMLAERYRERLSMAEVAQASGISERSLFDGFQRYYQRSPHQVLTDIRMEAARQLLREGLTAQAAARQAGFPHPGRFAAAYRRAFGLSPAEERAALRD